MSEFNDYLMGKKIDPDAFLQADAAQYRALEAVFLQVSPESFTQQKLFLINPLRRTHPLPPEKMPAKTATPKKSAKPTVPKPKPTLATKSGDSSSPKPTISMEGQATATKPTITKTGKPTMVKPDSNPNKSE
ncbi:MAG TPA: hypothetical protein DCE41_34340 [Cytophagales bacterium]|nr:hypothetical protein [Cytophagales bacterium]HAA22916.1 hypothetical protein [Cytophagales bacterium]HAP62571.1 hypothetical protein [Cytophagales bacterium]